jgi:hypothetical protein
MLNSNFVNNGEPDGGTFPIIATSVALVLSLQVFPDEEDEPAADLLDVEQGEVCAKVSSLDPVFLNICCPCPSAGVP